MTETSQPAAPVRASRIAEVPFSRRVVAFLQTYGILIIIALLMGWLTTQSSSFLTPLNLLNILNQSAPLAIIACALTLVIIGGGFDLSAGAIFGVASVSAAWLAVNVDPTVGLIAGPLVGLLLGIVNGLIITGFNVHSFLATLASSMVFRGIAILITGGALIPVRMPEFAFLGRGKIGMVNVAVIVFLVFAAAMTFLLTRTTFGRRVFAVGGNEEAAILSGVRTNLVKIATFGLTGFAAGLAGVIAVSRISMGQPQAGVGMELDAIAAVILGGTSIYGGKGAVWRSIAGVLLLALIGNGFNILNVNPFFKDLTTGLIIVVAVALSAGRKRR
ncbi:monosaccharide ABC transporter membrane protein, CUT2 family (TC 3.A.1.2.-) [Kaistia soli DSM 19436]|uniref:Monosaccharide ABC transporter membrane protein, CUT2 family (TC 3.A.1.2.-) n=1 Tax=Kaistia soli DSM 19436 TaxID=1122133 RepID=A0A1M5KF13_9HYPH|nr:ABC transporter permease [Kaistia soli]SHG51338.1 monosaccharide ABC transporter membrane protein, CUT2 family (TC 3.A.1.2.-) [Kaistia soli DSM 19436]